MSRPLRFVLPALVAACSLTACGGDPPTTRSAGATVEVRLVDYRVRPLRVRSPDGRLTVRVRNDGRLPHNLHIRGRGGTRMKLSTLLPGESGTATVTLPKGDWRMFCSIGNHEELGMYGALITR